LKKFSRFSSQIKSLNQAKILSLSNHKKVPSFDVGKTFSNLNPILSGKNQLTQENLNNHVCIQLRKLH